MRATPHDHVNICPCCGAHLLFSLDAKANDELVKEWGEDLLLGGRSRYYVEQLMYRYRTYIKPELGMIPVRAIDTLTVKAFFRKLKKHGLSTKTEKHILGVLHGWLSWLHLADAIDKMPAFPPLKVVHREKAWLSTESQQLVIDTLPARYRLMAAVYFATGARPSEIAALKVMDIEDGGVWIRRAFDEYGELKATKTATEVHRAIDPAHFSELVKSVRLRLPEAWIFTRRDGRPHSRHSIFAIIKRATRRCGFEIAPYQAARHSKASQARVSIEAAGRDALRSVLGHTSARTTLKHYALPGSKEIKR